MCLILFFVLSSFKFILPSVLSYSPGCTCSCWNTIYHPIKSSTDQWWSIPFGNKSLSLLNVYSHYSNELTWRDVQHLLVRSAARYRFKDTSLKTRWTRNGRGLFCKYFWIASLNRKNLSYTKQQEAPSSQTRSSVWFFVLQEQ